MQNLLKPKQALLALAMVLTPTLIYGQTQSGTLDATFGSGGKVTTAFAAPATAGEVAIQPDGKIVVVGKVSLTSTLDDFAVARYNTDGTLDASFGSGGKVTTDFTGGFDIASFVVIQPDGKIVVAGTAGVAPFANFGLARYNSDGTLDLSFGTGGKVTTNFGNVSSQAYSLALQPDGKIVLAGYVNFNGGESFGLARYNTDGTLDAGFGTGGKVHTEFDGVGQTFSFAFAYFVAIQQDGKIVAAGESTISGNRDFALARYNSNGTPDAGFGTGGKVTTDFVGFADVAAAVVIQPDGKIVAAGAAATSTAASSSFNFALARYNSNGTLDTAFGTGGKVATDFAGASDTASGVAVEPDGKIIAAGTATINGFVDSAFGLARYNSDGTLDPSFGTGGKVTTNFGANSDGASSIALQQDGKIVAAGVAEINGNFQFALARYLNETSSPTSTPSPTPSPTPPSTPSPTPSPTAAPTPEPTTVQLSAAAYSVNEGDNKIVVTVTRTGSTATAASVNYSTIDLNSLTCGRVTGAADPRCDYIRTTGTLEFAPGETSKDISVLLVDDAYAEGNETFPFRLSLPTGANLGEPNEATLTINDNDFANSPNDPIDDTAFFVRQQYLDMLNREPDSEGLAFWINEITSCGSNQSCIEVKRINVSAAFFLSIEFQESGYLLYRLNKVAYRQVGGVFEGGVVTFPPVPITLREFTVDRPRISNGIVVGAPNWQQDLANNKRAFVLEFVQRPTFLTLYPDSLTAQEFVTRLDANAGGVLSSTERAELVTLLGAVPTDVTKRAEVLLAVADDADLRNAELNNAFVLMEYYGYLRRNPDDLPDLTFDGWRFWVNKLNQFNGNFVDAEMVKAFISSSEYRQRFGP